jgi:hypothetical protein
MLRRRARERERTPNGADQRPCAVCRTPCRSLLPSRAGVFLGRRFRHLSKSLRVPSAVLVLEVLGSALALGLLAAYLAIVGRGVLAVLLASGLVAFLLLVTADLDRRTRGMIRIPDTALTNQLASMTEPPAATAPRSIAPSSGRHAISVA